jgi:hypothetical protein
MPLDVGSLSLGELPDLGKSTQLRKPIGEPHSEAPTKPKGPKVRYYKHTIEDSNKIIDLVISTLGWVFNRADRTIVRPDRRVYKVNSEFHVTVLFPQRAKGQAEAATLTNHLGAKVSIRATEVGVNDDFICIGVEGIEYDTDEIPYYGNDVMHITFAMADPINGCKKLQAIESYTALNPVSETGRVIRLANPFIFPASFCAHMSW